jgi:hypothetical protein
MFIEEGCTIVIYRRIIVAYHVFVYYGHYCSRFCVGTIFNTKSISTAVFSEFYNSLMISSVLSTLRTAYSIVFIRFYLLINIFVLLCILKINFGYINSPIKTS